MQTIEAQKLKRRSPAPVVARGDRIFAGLTTAVSMVVLVLLVVMTAFLITQAWPALHSAKEDTRSRRQNAPGPAPLA